MFIPLRIRLLHNFGRSSFNIGFLFAIIGLAIVVYFSFHLNWSPSYHSLGWVVDGISLTGTCTGPDSDGDLFVSSYASDIVIQYDGTTGQLVGTFASDAALGVEELPEHRLRRLMGEAGLDPAGLDLTALDPVRPDPSLRERQS